MSLLGVFGGGLFIIPLILLAASAYSFYRGYKQWKSGSAGYVFDENGKPTWTESDKRVKFWTIGSVVFGIGFFVAFIIVVILMAGDK